MAETDMRSADQDGGHTTRYRRRWIAGALVVLVLLGGMFTLHPFWGVVPHAAAAGGLPPNDDFQVPLDFHDGWVQHHPKVYLVFWGPKWSKDAIHQAAKSTVESVFTTLAGSQYNNILTQYYDSSDHVHNDVQLMGSWIDATTPVPGLFIGVENGPGGEIKDEAVKAFGHWGLSPNKDTQILVFPQQGSTYRTVLGFIKPMDACGMHSYAPESAYQLSYSWVRYAPDYACYFTGDDAKNIAWTAVHEYAETVTDPHIYFAGTAISGSGWYHEPRSAAELSFTPQEVADLCEGYNNGNSSPYYGTSSGSYIVPYLWSNWSANTDANKGCVLYEGQDFDSPDHTPPFTGKHTVQGGILDKYRGQCGQGANQTACLSLLGSPMSEEGPLAGGAVSYFSTNLPCIQAGPAGSASAIYYGPGVGIHSVSGCIYYHYWHDLNGPEGLLGFPSSDELVIPGAAVSYFSNRNPCIQAGPSNSSSAIYASGMGIHSVFGCIYYHYWHDLNGPGGVLGFPTSDEQAIPGGAVSYFSNGALCNQAGPSNSASAIYASSLGTYSVIGCIYYHYWHDFGGPGGALGFPLSDEYDTPQGRQSDFQHGSLTYDNRTGQVQMQRSGGAPAVAANKAGGYLEAFQWGNDGSLWHDWQQPGSNTGWSGWKTLQGALAGPPVARANDDGRLEVFARLSDGALHHTWQLTPGGSWSGWYPLDSGFRFRGQPAVAWNVDGRLELFVRGADNALWHNWQLTPGGSWSGWYSLGGGIAGSPAVENNVDGRLEVVVRGIDGALYHTWQLTSGGSWSGFARLGGSIRSDPVVERNFDGRLEAFAQGTDNQLYHVFQLTRGGSWSGVSSLGGALTGPPSAGINISNGQVEVVARWSDGTLWHIWQQPSTSKGWSGWYSLGGSLQSNPTMIANFDGQLEVFMQGSSGAYFHDFQTTPAGSWSGWIPL